MEIKELCVYKVHMRDAHAQEICTFDPIDYKEHVYIRRVTNANVDVWLICIACVYIFLDTFK